MNFAEALNVKLGSVDRPKLPPVGSYDFQITKQPVMVTRGDFDVVDIMCQAVEATPEVDPDELAAFGIKNVQARVSFLFDKNDQTKFDRTMFNLQTFLIEHVGLPAGTSIKEGLANCVHQRFRASTRITNDKENPEIQYFNIDRTAPIK